MFDFCRDACCSQGQGGMRGTENNVKSTRKIRNLILLNFVIHMFFHKSLNNFCRGSGNKQTNKGANKQTKNQTSEQASNVYLLCRSKARDLRKDGQLSCLNTHSMFLSC